MNRTPLSRRTQIINCLVEGNSIRSTERMTDTHRDTIMRLMVESRERLRCVGQMTRCGTSIAAAFSATKSGYFAE